MRVNLRRTAAAALAAVALLADARPGSAAGDAPLVEAARARDRAAVAALIKRNADVNATQPDGAAALHWAAHWNDLDVVDLLVRAGAHVDAANRYGVTPLWLASENGSAPMIETLLRAGARPNVPLRSGETPLMAAARAGNVAAVSALLAGGADVAAKEAAHGQTSLMWAAAENHLEVMRALIDRGADVNGASKVGFTPLMFVARQGDVNAATLLLGKGADVNAASTDGSTALVVATVRGHVDLALFLLDRGADANADRAGYTALHWASGIWEATTTFDYRFMSGEWTALGGVPDREGKLRLIDALLAHKANVNAQITKAPPRFGSSLFLQNLLTGATPFSLAAMAGDQQVMRLLHKAGADPRLPTKNNTTPLIAAAGLFRVDNETRVPEGDLLGAVTLALELGNDVNAANDVGETALHAAALAGLDTIVQYLVDRGASLTRTTKDGKTPLTTAEGTVVAMQLIVRPSTVALLKKLGGK